MAHLDTAFHDIEMDVGDSSWERWYDAVEKAIHPLYLDVDDSRGAYGYSLDGAYDWYLNGCTVEAYAKLVHVRRARRGLT